MPTLKDIAKILVQKHELKQRDADLFVNAFVDTILEGLKSDRQVKIKGFGTFKVTSVRDRESVNVNTGERVIISGHDKISFTPDAVMRDIVNKPFAQFETVILADGVSFEDIPDSTENEEEDIQPETPAPAEPKAEEAPAPAEPIVKETPPPAEPKTEEATAPAKPIVKETPAPAEPKAEEATAPAKPIVKETPAPAEPKAEEAPAPVTPKPQPMQIVEPSTNIVEEEKDEEKEEEEENEEPSDSKSDCKNIFILYAIVANILIAAIAFVLGYLCATNNWLGLDRKANEDLSSIEYIQEDSIVEVNATAPTAESIHKTDSVNTVTANPKVTESTAKTAPAPENENSKEEAKAIPATPSKPASSEAKAPVNNKTEQAKPQQTPSTGKYDSDPRVRTGAYTIVGTANTIKVRAGQTLKSISKSYLGEGMECYVEVYNGGIKQVAEGQTIKIPKLELKKKKK